MRRVALITGITGQDGSYLTEFLLKRGYEVHGIVRRVALEDPGHRLQRILHIRDRLILHSGSIDSFPSVYKIVQLVKPTECYHLAAQSFVSYSFEDAHSTLATNIAGTHYILDALRDIAPECRFYFAASSEMFGAADEVPQNELTRFHPRSPYGISKATGFHMTRHYREAYGMFAVNGILFNHESPRRGREFVTRKISYTAALIKAGLASTLPLGNLDARRDWGHAREYVTAMWLMLQHTSPDDVVIATGETHSVREFAEVCFSELGLDLDRHLRIDSSLFRPAEVSLLVGDASKAKRLLGWTHNVSFAGLCVEMVSSDLEAVRRLPTGH